MQGTPLSMTWMRSPAAHGGSQLGWGDRVCLRWTAWTFAGLAAVVLVATVGAVGAWWHVAGREGIEGGGRTWPALAAGAVGLTAAVALYGLSRVCRTVARLCVSPEPSTWRASSNTLAVSRPSRPGKRESVGGSRGAIARHA